MTSSGRQKLKTGLSIFQPAGFGVDDFDQDDFQHVPDLYTGPDTSRYRFVSSPAGDVHMENRFSITVRKNSTDPGHLMNILQYVLQGMNRPASSLLRSNDQSAPLVSAAHGDDGSRSDRFFSGEFLDCLVNDLTVFESNNEETALPCFRILHRSVHLQIFKSIQQRFSAKFIEPVLTCGLGHSVLILVAGTSMGAARKLIENRGVSRTLEILRRASGAVILAIGLYFAYTALA